MWWLWILGIIIYLLVGRITANLLVENGIVSFYDEDWTKTMITLFFPIALLWYGIIFISELITG